MNPLNCVTNISRDSIDLLKTELRAIEERMAIIREWDLPDEVTEKVINELKKQKNEIKERFHNLIDTL